MKGSDVVAAQLAAENVDTVLTIPGVHNVHLCDSLLDYPQIQILTGRHEQGLTLMANGYTRASGKIAVPIVISGPGVTNSLTALADAYLDSVPMVLVAAASDAAHLGRGALHELKSRVRCVPRSNKPVGVAPARRQSKSPWRFSGSRLRWRSLHQRVLDDPGRMKCMLRRPLPA